MATENEQNKKEGKNGVLIILGLLILGGFFYLRWRNSQTTAAAAPASTDTGGTASTTDAGGSTPSRSGGIPASTSPVLPGPIAISNITNPDGSITTVYGDGSTVTKSPAGAILSSTKATKTVISTTTNTDGSVTTVYSDGSTITVSSAGAVLKTTPATSTAPATSGSSSSINQLMPPAQTATTLSGTTNFSNSVGQGSGLIYGAPGSEVIIQVNGGKSASWKFDMFVETGTESVDLGINSHLTSKQASFTIPAKGNISYTAQFEGAQPTDYALITLTS